MVLVTRVSKDHYLLPNHNFLLLPPHLQLYMLFKSIKSVQLVLYRILLGSSPVMAPLQSVFSLYEQRKIIEKLSTWKS